MRRSRAVGHQTIASLSHRSFPVSETGTDRPDFGVPKEAPWKHWDLNGLYAGGTEELNRTPLAAVCISLSDDLA